MLGNWRSNNEYQNSVFSALKELVHKFPESIEEHKDKIYKMLLLNLDSLKTIIESLYSHTGRPAQLQPEIFRSFVLMRLSKEPLNNWVDKLKNNPVLRTIAGFTSDNLPKTSSYYDFINRIINLDDRAKLKKVKIKPKTKLKKGEKLPNKHPGITEKLASQIILDEAKFNERLGRREEKYLQEIFAQTAVSQSSDLGLIPDSLTVSGDGTCIETGASPYGVKICKCKEEGTFNCTCDRKFSDPNAAWGWDSHNEVYFYGYTGYFISTYNKNLKTDLPLYLRLVEAGRHDSVSAIIALTEFRSLYPNIHINTFVSDSASDNSGTYKLLDHWGINAVIALNKRRTGDFTYPPASKIDDNGIPICPGGHKMIYNGFCIGRCRIKWRCPRVLGKVEVCNACSSCSPSPYGRVFYTKPDWDLRLFTKIPRGSAAWKSKMKERTSSERINNRILNDYGIENSKTRGKKRISFFVTIAGICIHLDAQFKYKKLNETSFFDSLLDIQSAV